MTTSVIDAINGVTSQFDQFKTKRFDPLEKKLDSILERIESAEALADRPSAGGTSSKTGLTSEDHEHKNLFVDWIRRPGDERCKSRLAEAQHQMQQKDVSIGTPSAGGYGLPKEISRAIETRVRQLNPFRSLVDVVSCSSNDFNYLVSMGDGTSGWSSETGSRSGTSTPTLRNRAPTFGELYALPTASNWSLEDVQFDVQQWLVDDISAEWASQEATVILTGSGSNRPTGILNASPSASDDDASPLRSADAIEYIPMVPTSSPFTSSTQNLIDGAIDLVAQVKENYLTETDRLAFVMHRLTAAKIRKLKASTAGSYLWTDAANGNPATLAGYRVLTCDAMAQSSTLNAFPILFGNWRRGYLLADRTSMQITLDPYSTPGQTRFYARRRVGGCVKSNDAIKALKVAVS